MTRKAKLAATALALAGMAVLLLIFLAWRQGGLTLLQLDLVLC